MLRLALVLSVLAFGSATFADDKTELKALAGTWVTDKIEVEGSDLVFDVKLVIDGNKYTVTIGDKVDSGTISLDSTKNPKTMDVVGTEGANKGKTYPCIYELKDGKLTICYSLDEKVRPAKMATAKDSKTMLAVYKKK